jgi:hypothetical protein
MKTRKPDKKHEYDIKDNGKNATGRPSLYTPEHCKDIYDYFANAPKTRQVLKASISGKNDYHKDEYEIIPCELPTISKWAIAKGIALSTVYEWEKNHTEFSESLSTIREMYKNFLNDNALMGYYNPIYSKFVAINTTDMKDKQETDVNIKTFEEIAKAKKEYGL